MAKNIKSNMTKEQKNAERLKAWKQDRAAHKPKNRSSKHLRFFHVKDIYRCMSTAVLTELSKKDDFAAAQELARRDKIHDKNEIRKARYQEKLAAKRAAKA